MKEFVYYSPYKNAFIIAHFKSDTVTWSAYDLKGKLSYRTKCVLIGEL